MMENKFICNFYANELQAEYRATRKCLEKIPENIYHFKPHPKSMELGYLALLVAEIPLWIVHIIKEGVVDFVTYKHFQLSTSEALLQHYEENFKNAMRTLQQTSDDKLEDQFILRNGEQQLMSSSKKESLGSSINHWVHHRGQLTVYMRLNDIAVPSIYGPSADEKKF
ncbi:MAG: DinB family protein [Chitinophagaceae bacterium]